jgi:hypothetical protein
MRRRKAGPPALHARLRQTLRLLWLRSPERSAALKQAWVSRGRYQCKACEGVFGPKEVQVDHVEACGSLLCTADLSTFATRLFHGEQVVLCKPCHAQKTAAERAAKQHA